jgi:hypothetical protein
MKLVPFLATAVLTGGTIYYANDAYAADAVTKTEPAPAATTEPIKVSPELMRQNAALGVMQGHMNMLLTQRQALDVQIKGLQQQIDDGTAMKDKLSK